MRTAREERIEMLSLRCNHSLFYTSRRGSGSVLAQQYRVMELINKRNVLLSSYGEYRHTTSWRGLHLDTQLCTFMMKILMINIFV